MTLRVKSLKLENVGLFSEISFEFNDSLNVICGPNGVGKTTILEAIAAGFNNPQSYNRTNMAKFQNGTVELALQTSIKMPEHFSTIKILPRRPKLVSEMFNQPRPFSLDILFINTTRDLNYSLVENIPRDNVRNEMQSSRMMDTGVDNNDLKSWLVKRILLKDVGTDAWTAESKANTTLAIDSIAAIDEFVHFNKVTPTDFEIYISTPNGIILFESLSSGYKTVFFIILGIIKEIELRFQNIFASEFDGVVLIDEIDLHLHPEWQRKVVSILRDIFPKIQFILTTHSPHVVQAVNPGEVIALARNEAGDIVLRRLPDLRYGFQGWTIEEILHDIMDMPSTQSKALVAASHAFDQALDDEDAERVIEYRDILLAMLHKNNPLQKLIRMQAARYQVSEVS